jgi:hypothetical protein
VSSLIMIEDRWMGVYKGGTISSRVIHLTEYAPEKIYCGQEILNGILVYPR